MNGDQMSIVNMIGLVMCLGGIACHIVHKFALTKSIQSAPVISNGTISMTSPSTEQHLRVNYVNMTKQNMKLNFFSNQRTPLLDSTDEHSDDYSDDSRQNASEVIFDVLKRRDIRR